MNRVCSVEGCNGKCVGLGYCAKHYQQIRICGKIKRTMFDPNEIIMYDDYAEIILYNNRGIEVARALIDIEDVEKVSQYKWHLNGKSYVVTTVNGKTRFLHRLIMNVWQDEFNFYTNVVDHINRNKLDNRKSNLRICSTKENNENKNWNKKVIAIIDNKPFIVFDTIKQGAEYFGINDGDICNCCKGKKHHKTCGKYNGKKIVWKYLFIEEL